MEQAETAEADFCLWKWTLQKPTVCNTPSISRLLLINHLGFFLVVNFKPLVIVPPQGHANKPLSDSPAATPVTQSANHGFNFLIMFTFIIPQPSCKTNLLCQDGFKESTCTFRAP